MDKLIETSKRFMVASGGCWHERKGHNIPWTCALCGYVQRNGLEVERVNPTYTIESIKAAIQAWPCGIEDCENGRIEVGGTVDGKPVEPDYVPCPDCTDGKRNIWSSFLAHLYGHILTALIDGFDETVSGSEDIPWSETHAAIIFGRIITTPEPLMAEFLWSMEVKD